MTFAEAMARPEHRINVAEAALLFARELRPSVDPALYEAKIEHLAREAREQMPAAGEDVRCLALSQFLFDRKGYRGNTQRYDDPRNSLLNEVIDRRLGIPITLATLYVEVGRRAGLALCGVGFPGHFLARHVGTGMVIDCFDGGKVLERADCERLLRSAYGPEAELDDRFLMPARPRETVVRMLNNLKFSFANLRAYEDSLRVIRLIDVAWPNLPDNVRDRGLVELALQRFPSALKDLQEYARLAPEASDAGEILKQIDRLKKTLAALN
jgi:regulator of sirC expression with transglutaminase-like and TPR domain